MMIETVPPLEPVDPIVITAIDKDYHARWIGGTTPAIYCESCRTDPAIIRIAFNPPGSKPEQFLICHGCLP